MHLFREKGPSRLAVSHISKTRFKAEKCLKRPPNSSNYKAFEFRRLVLQCAVSVVCSCLAGRWSARLVLRQHQRFVWWTLQTAPKNVIIQYWHFDDPNVQASMVRTLAVQSEFATCLAFSCLTGRWPLTINYRFFYKGSCFLVVLYEQDNIQQISDGFLNGLQLMRETSSS